MNIMNKQQIAIGLAGYALLVLWFFSYKLGCFALIFLLFVAGVIFKNTFDLIFAKRLCLANCYFQKDSIIYNLLTKTFSILLVSFFIGILLAASLLLNVANFTPIDFFIFALDVFVIIFLYNYFIENNSFNEKVKFPILKNIVAWINSIFLLIILLVISFFQTPPEYIQSDLSLTVQKASNQVFSACSYIDYVLRLINEITAMKWWGMLNFTTYSADNYYIKEIVWLLFLLGNYLAVFGFSRYIVEIIYFTKDQTDE